MKQAFCVLMVALLALPTWAQIYRVEPAIPGDPTILLWSTECQTQWRADWQRWIPCTEWVVANSSGDATLCVSAPGCNYSSCQPPYDNYLCRYAEADSPCLMLRNGSLVCNSEYRVWGSGI